MKGICCIFLYINRIAYFFTYVWHQHLVKIEPTCKTYIEKVFSILKRIKQCYCIFLNNIYCIYLFILIDLTQYDSYALEWIKAVLSCNLLYHPLDKTMGLIDDETEKFLCAYESTTIGLINNLTSSPFLATNPNIKAAKRYKHTILDNGNMFSINNPMMMNTNASSGYSHTSRAEESVCTEKKRISLSTVAVFRSYSFDIFKFAGENSILLLYYLLLFLLLF